MRTFKFVIILMVCMLTQGCVGVLVFKKDSTTIKNPHVEMSASVEGVYGTNCVEYTGTWLKSNWGTPKTVKVVSSNEELWTYEFTKQCWGGVMPMIIVPIPLVVPTGTEKVVFLIQDNRIVSAQRVKRKASGIGGGLGPDGCAWFR